MARNRVYSKCGLNKKYLSLMVLIPVFFLSFSSEVRGQETSTDEKKALSHESEGSVSIASGNSESESYLFKQKTSYEKNVHKGILTGSYQLNQGITGESTKFQTTTRKWDTGLRYEYGASKYFSPYISFGMFSDVFAGLIQRNTWGLGGKYWFLKKEDRKVSGELGMQNVFEILEVGPAKTYNSGRAFLEGEYDLKSNVKFKLWVEYLSNIDDSEDYELNYEPSIAVKMTTIFSMKVAYQSRYDNVPATDDVEKLDTIFTTALLAEF